WAGGAVAGRVKFGQAVGRVVVKGEREGGDRLAAARVGHEDDGLALGPRQQDPDVMGEGMGQALQRNFDFAHHAQLAGDIDGGRVGRGDRGVVDGNEVGVLEGVGEHDAEDSYLAGGHAYQITDQASELAARAGELDIVCGVAG